MLTRRHRTEGCGSAFDLTKARPVLADVKTAKNYVVAALDELAAGKPVSVSATRAYGCSVKYKTS